jgi:hypothetical protein
MKKLTKKGRRSKNRICSFIWPCKQAKWYKDAADLRKPDESKKKS